MILVDITVPSLGKTYNFSLNESVRVSDLIDEITDMIEQREHTMMDGDRILLNLYDAKLGHVLNRTCSLTRNGVIPGHRLILV